MGWRAIRLGLDRPALLRTQTRALLKAAAGRELRLMFPMVTEIAEFERARAIVERERVHLARHGHPAAEQVALGAMIEVPALLFQLDDLFRVADFASVGSNDLMQFMNAADRGNTRLAGRFDPLSPAFLRALRDIVRAAERAGKPVTLCGELAGRPLEAMALGAVGFRLLSMAPAAIGPVKAMLRGLDLGAVAGRIGGLIDQGAPASETRAELRAWAETHNMPV